MGWHCLTTASTEGSSSDYLLWLDDVSLSTSSSSARTMT
jgi:hypothetical protein